MKNNFVQNVDAVFTWVNDGDPEWKRKRDKALEASGLPFDRNAINTARWHNKDELRFALRSLWLNAPWFRRIYIVTDNQRPEWLDANQNRVCVIDHQAIFPDTNCLPVFNSHAIEACLHHIEGLSEHFVYFNDDIMIGRSTTRADFFTQNGKSIAYIKSSTRVPDPECHSGDVDAYEAAAMNARAAIKSTTGHDCAYRFHHGPSALMRSRLFEMEAIFADELRKTRTSRFRSANDIPLTSFMFPWYGWTRGWVDTRRLAHKNNVMEKISLSRWSFLKKSARVFVNRPKFINLNDSENGSVPPWVRRVSVRTVAGRLFPHTAPWELK